MLLKAKHYLNTKTHNLSPTIVAVTLMTVTHLVATSSSFHLPALFDLNHSITVFIDGFYLFF